VREIEACDADLLSALALLFQSQVRSKQSAPCNPDFLEASERRGWILDRRLGDNLLPQPANRGGQRHGSRKEPSSIHCLLLACELPRYNVPSPGRADLIRRTTRN